MEAEGEWYLLCQDGVMSVLLYVTEAPQGLTDLKDL
jgi:hypothetical protein